MGISGILHKGCYMKELAYIRRSCLLYLTLLICMAGAVTGRPLTLISAPGF